MRLLSFFFKISAVATGLLAFCSASASEGSLVTAVFSSASKNYKRQTQPDGTLKYETYVVGNGGYSAGSEANKSIDDVSFPTIIQLLAKYLARQSYFPAREAKAADLLLVISWGTTHPFDDGGYRNGLDSLSSAMGLLKTLSPIQNLADKMSPGSGQASFSPGANPGVLAAANDAAEGQLIQMEMFNDMRSKADEGTARLLGYTAEINRTNNLSRFAGGGSYFDDLISDIENQRYYVIVSAYDFHALMQQKKKELVWITRVSIRAQGNQFDRSVAAMLATASHQFGRSSGGLLRKYQEGVVTFGEMKIMGVVPNDALPEKPAPEK